MANKISIGVDVDEQGKGASSIRNLNSQLDTIGGSATKAASGLRLVNDSLGSLKAFVAGGALISLGKGLLEAAVSSEQANRRLSASATEAGLSYADLAKNSRQFALDARISNTEAANTVSELSRLAQLSGRTQDLELIQKRFLDLAAARGVATSQLSTIARQVIAGEDEGINRLGLPNPSKIYEEYAKSVGKTTDALSQQEQIQSVLNALLEKAAIFAGANADAQAGLTGQTQEATKAISDLGTNFGVALTSSSEFQESLKITNEILKSIGTSADDVRTKLKNGVTPEQIADEESKKTSTRLADLARAASQQTGAVGGFVSDLFTDGFNTALSRFNESSLENTAKRTKERILQLAKGAQKEILAQEAQAAEQAKQNALKAAGETALSNDAAVTKKYFESIAQSKNVSLQMIKEANEYLKDNKDVLSTKDVEKYTKQLQDLFVKQSETIKKTRDDLRSFLTDISSSATDNKFAKLFIEMDTAAERAQKRFGALGKEVVDLATKLDRANIAKQINEATDASRLAALKLNQQANALDRPIIGLSGAEGRRLSTLDARINANTATDDNRNLAEFYRSLNSFNKFSGQAAPSANLAETFQRFTQAQGFEKDRLADVGINQLSDVLSQVLSLRSLGGANADEKGAIGAAVLQKIQSIPDEILRNSKLESVRSLREIGAQSATDAAALAQQKAREVLERELAGNQIRADAQGQVNLIGGDFSDKNKVSQIIATLSSLSPDELTGDLRQTQAKALRAQAGFEFNQKNEGLEISRKTYALLDNINKQMAGKGIPVDFGETAIIDINVSGDQAGSSITPVNSPTPAPPPLSPFGALALPGFGN